MIWRLIVLFTDTHGQSTLGGLCVYIVLLFFLHNTPIWTRFGYLVGITRLLLQDSLLISYRHVLLSELMIVFISFA